MAASLAGLPAEYIVQQAKDFVSGARRSAVPDLFPQVLMVTASGKIQRVRAHEISQVGRNTQGVRVIRVDEGNSLVSVARITRKKGLEARTDGLPAVRLPLRTRRT